MHVFTALRVCVCMCLVNERIAVAVPMCVNCICVHMCVEQFMCVCVCAHMLVQLLMYVRIGVVCDVTECIHSFVCIPVSDKCACLAYECLFSCVLC